MSAVCPTCGNKFTKLAMHWNASSECDYPSITPKQKDIITGLMMGDGEANETSRNTFIRVRNINRQYLEYLHRSFDYYSNGVLMEKTAEELAEHNRETGFYEKAKKESYSDLYVWRTRCSPEFNIFGRWYKEDKKVFPSDIDISPIILKHWYCCDGHRKKSNNSKYIRISCSNERKNKDKIEEIFSSAGFEVSGWEESQRNDGSWRCSIRFNRSESMRLWEYMGEPLPGFEYKWPKEFK